MAVIVRRMQTGDARAFMEIMDEFQPRLSNVIGQMLQDDDETKDVIQETFIRVHRHISTFNFNHQFSTWIYTIALNLARNLLRRHKRIHAEPLEDHQNTLFAPNHDPATHSSHVKLSSHITVCLSMMPEKYRIAFRMVDMDGRSYTEAAEMLDIPLGTIKSRTNRARIIMRQYLAHHCPAILQHYRVRIPPVMDQEKK